jgi:hypothetical protein
MWRVLLRRGWVVLFSLWLWRLFWGLLILLRGGDLFSFFCFLTILENLCFVRVGYNVLFDQVFTPCSVSYLLRLSRLLEMRSSYFHSYHPLFELGLAGLDPRLWY